jgi:hypothetical protein
MGVDESQQTRLTNLDVSRPIIKGLVCFFDLMGNQRPKIASLDNNLTLIMYELLKRGLGDWVPSPQRTSGGRMSAPIGALAYRDLRRSRSTALCIRTAVIARG